MQLSSVPSCLRAFLTLACAFVVSLSATAAPVISEIVASNKTGLTDRDGDYSDWIELFNPDTTPVDLAGWYLSDNASNRTKWRFPAVSIPAQGFLIVFASSKDRRDPADELHTNFALSADGEYLGLTQPDGTTVASAFAPAFPAQTTDVAYGIPGNTGTSLSAATFLQSPTPRAPNAPAAVRESARITPGTQTFATSLLVTLAGAGTNQVIRYDLVAPGETGLAAAGPTAASPRYDGPISITSSVQIRAAVFSADGASAGPVATALFTRLAETAASFSSGLPVVVLDPHGRGPIEKSEGELSAWLQLFQPREDQPARLVGTPDFSTPIGLAVRGSTSSEFPKKSFSVELHTEAGGNRPTALLGLAEAADWALVSPWSIDPAYLRSAYVYALSNQLGRWAPRTRFVETFVKSGGPALEAGHYAGLSVLTERIKVASNLLAITPLKSSDVTAPAVTGGYLLKFDPKDEDEFGWVTGRGFPLDEGIGSGTMLVVASPKADDLAPAQRDYIQGYVQDFENALFADRENSWATRGYLDYIDLPSWVDFHLLQVLTKNPDGLARSAYFHKDRGGKLKAGPVWDFDRAMSSTDARSEHWDEWNDPTNSAALWNHGWWGVMSRDPAFMQAWIDRWQALRSGPLSDENLTGLANSLAAQIDPAAAERDAARWPENAGRFENGFRGEVDYLARWLTQRAQWIDQQFTARPVEMSADGTRKIVAPPGSLIAYTLDGTDPRGADGKPTASAILVSGPLTLIDGTYTIRIYDPAAATRFPGTPWSAASTHEIIGGPTTPGVPGVTSAPQLINLATRGTVDGSTTLVCGLAVGPGSQKRYLIRAVGPTLGLFEVADALSDPVLRILDANGTEIARNQDWRTNPDRTAFATATAAVGAFPLSDSARDAAVILTLAPGTYTVEVSSERGGRGAALAEIYALDAGSVVANLSTRAWLARGESVIGGVTLAGSEPRRLLVRAIGPSLTQFGITDALPDPTLALYSGPNLLAANDDWTFSSNASEIASVGAATGAFPLVPGSKDAALLIEVSPGSYTVQAHGKDGAGTTLIEVYDVP
jgi:hypothetical protein